MTAGRVPDGAMGRRGFLRRSVLSGVALGLTACSGPRACIRSRAPGDAAVLGAIGPALGGVLARAARAPSSHNTQPWTVRVIEPDRWIIAGDSTRRLPVVDPDQRELSLSLGAFLEHLVVAASAIGYDTAVSNAQESPGGPRIEVQLQASKGPDHVEAASQIDRRRTLRKRYLETAVQRADLDVLLEALGPGARWFPRGSPEAGRLVDWAIASFEQQTWQEAAQRELASWTRLGAAASEAIDGLTPETMEVEGLAGFYLRRLVDERAVMGKTFRQGGIDLAREQAHQGAGWLVLSSVDESVAALLDAGRRFARMALRLRERRLAAHPMSQVLEEAPWRHTLARDLALEGPPQLVLRVGYVQRYGEPVSPRRSIGAFTTVGT